MFVLSEDLFNISKDTILSNNFKLNVSLKFLNLMKYTNCYVYLYRIYVNIY